MSNPNMLRRAESVLLDYSGTLSNDRELVYEANQLLLEQHGEPRLTLAQWRGGHPGWNASNFLAEKYKHLKVQDLYGEFAELLTFLKTALGMPQLYPGALEFVSSLYNKRKRIEIISSHPQVHLDAELAVNGLARIVTIAQGGVFNKAEAIGASLEQRNHDPEKTVYAGDTVEDMWAAHKNSIGAIAVTYGYHTKKRLEAANPDLMVHSLKKLASYL